MEEIFVEEGDTDLPEIVMVGITILNNAQIVVKVGLRMNVRPVHVIILDPLHIFVIVKGIPTVELKKSKRVTITVEPHLGVLAIMRILHLDNLIIATLHVDPDRPSF